MASDKLKEQFTSYYQTLNDIDLNKIYRKHLGNYTLDYEQMFNHIFEMLSSVYEIREEIGNKTITDVISAMRSLHSFSNGIINLSDPQFIEFLPNNKEKFKSIYSDFTDLSVYLKLYQQPTVVEDKNTKAVENLLRKLEGFEKEIEENKQLKDKLENELETLDGRYKELFTKAEVFNQSRIFKDEAEQHKKNSNWWLIGIIFSILIFAIILKCIIKDFCFEVNCLLESNVEKYNSICKDCGKHVLMLEIVKSILYRTLIISLCLYCINFCVKNYNNCMHNKTVNTHKQNSLEAALVLLEKTSEKGGDEIISLAGQAIFLQQKTGYIGKEDAINLSLIDQILKMRKEI